MARVRIGPALPDRKAVEIEIAGLRNLDLATLRGRWHTVFGRRPPAHLSRHLLYRTLAYRLQADRFGGLDAASERLLDRTASAASQSGQAVAGPTPTTTLRTGTVLGREWKGRMHRVAVMTDGFAWNGETYRSLSKIAFAITGTRWNGPKFFGLREQRGEGASR